MDSASSPTSSVVQPPPVEAETAAKREVPKKEMAHRTKVIQFMGRTKPIILQNDNGPCSLIAICNVLLLKNILNLSPDISEVSQEKLLSLVADHLIASNSTDNIADAIDLLPKLATGIDVDIKFGRIDDFEFTRDCTIFDLLDIPLYHGWIIDPQDKETANAIGPKSYNTIVVDLVSPAPAKDSENQNDPEDGVDFVAETTAALGVPSPCLSRGQSFDESPNKARKGDIEEERELLRFMKLSEAEMFSSVPDSVTYENQEPVYEGEVVFAEQVGRGCVIDDEFKQGELIRNFLKNSASQLTIYGLSCLQKEVKERELCVFFRNNHFSTMFKYEGKLYILATDQGYLNQPDLVWEKLDEVNGANLYMTGNFTEFTMDDTGSNFNSDLQWAEHEFEQQKHKLQPNNLQQPSTSSASSLSHQPSTSSASHSNLDTHSSRFSNSLRLPAHRPASASNSTFRMVSTEKVRMIMDKKHNIRNTSIIGHLYHGKSTVACRVTDTYADEDECIMTTKLTPFSFCYKMSDESLKTYKGERHGDEYLINLIDSPGHVDFSHEVTAAFRITDGAIVVVDLIDGVLVQTEAVIRQAMAEGIRLVLTVNKMDRCFLEEHVMDGEEVYKSLEKVIEDTNKILATYEDADHCDIQVSPEKGNVVFCSGVDGWGFTLSHFAKYYASKTDIDEAMLTKRLWGENFFDTETNKWTKSRTDSETCARGFVKFVYNPIKNIIAACMKEKDGNLEKQKEEKDSNLEKKKEEKEGNLKKKKEGNLTKKKGDLWWHLEERGVNLTVEEKQFAGIQLMRCVMNRWLPVRSALLEMMIFKLPSPATAQRCMVDTLYCGQPNDSYAQSIRNCDPDGPLMLYVSKIIPNDLASDDLPIKLLAVARVFSGKVSSGLQVRIRGPNYLPTMCIDDKESIVKKGTVEDAYIWMGEKLEIIDDVPCGNIVALAGLRRGNTGATVTSCEEVDAHVIRGMNFTVTPILRIDIKCTQINVKNCLVRRIERLQLLDPMVISSLDDDVTGLFIGGVGELHLQICRKDLQDNVASLGQMTSSSPVVSFRESVHLWSARTASVRSLSIQLCMKARPMKAGLAKAIDDGRIGPHDDPEARSKILEEEFGWDKELAKQIWCFGPYNTGPNILVNMCKEVKHLDKIKDLVVSGFQQASKQGPLFGEKMWGICFELRDAVIDHKIDPKNFVYKREIVSNTKKVMYAAYLLANPILLEPMYLVGIRAPECHLEIIYQAIYEKMGHVLEEAKMPCTPFYNVKAYLPVRKSLGFFTNLRARTSDQIFHQQVFDHWRVLYSDPLDPETEAGKLVVETRMKKGMGKMEKVSDYEK